MKMPSRIVNRMCLAIFCRRALVHADETEAPISQELAGRLHDVQLGEARPDVVLVERRSLHDGAVVLGVTLAPDLGEVGCCEGVAEARAEQCTQNQALDRRQERTPAGRATRLEGLTEVAQAAHERILFDEEWSAAPTGSRPAARVSSFQGSGDVPSDPPLTRGLPTTRRNPTLPPQLFQDLLGRGVTQRHTSCTSPMMLSGSKRHWFL